MTSKLTKRATVAHSWRRQDAVQAVRVSLAEHLWTQRDLAKRCEVSDATISRLIAGAHASRSVVASVSTALGLDPAIVRKLEGMPVQ